MKKRTLAIILTVFTLAVFTAAVIAAISLESSRTMLEALAIILVVVGYANEKKIARWERRQVRKIKRIINNHGRA